MSSYVFILVVGTFLNCVPIIYMLIGLSGNLKMCDLNVNKLIVLVGGTIVYWGYIIKSGTAFCGNSLVLWVQKRYMFCGNNVICVYTLFKSVSGKMLV